MRHPTKKGKKCSHEEGHSHITNEGPVTILNLYGYSLEKTPPRKMQLGLLQVEERERELCVRFRVF